jgi:hypothetical protein
MGKDMLCQCMEGEFRFVHRDGHPFTAKKAMCGPVSKVSLKT